jgi:hypothetical protein
MLRRPLEVQTDIVGYPIFANFNVFNYFTQYYVAILCFPLLTLLLYELLARIWPGSDWPGGDQANEKVELPPAARALVRILPSLAVGGTLGTAWLLHMESPARWLILVPLTSAVLYTAVLWGAGMLARRRPEDRVALPSLLNVAVAPFTPLLLELLSRETWVAVQQPPSIVHYAPVPRSVTLVLTALALVWTAMRLRRGHRSADVRRLETSSVLLIVVPVLLVTYTAAIPRPLSGIDTFHQGEFVGAANLVSKGAFPWRDLLFIHGLLQDVLLPGLGFVTFGKTIWGAASGFDFWGTPLFWLAYYALFVYLFRRRPLLLLATVVVPVIGAFPFAHHRFILYPPILLALGALLRQPGWLQAFGLAAAVLIGNVLVPELAYATLASGVVLICWELSRRERGAKLADRLAGTWRFSVAGTVLLLVWCAFLQAHGSLGAFVDYYRTFASGHQLTGGIRLYPTSFADASFVRLMLLPPLSVVLVFWYVVSRRRRRIPLEERDWVVIAVTLATAAYYIKFLSRTDWHVAQAAAPALPLVFFLADRGLSALQSLVKPPVRPWVPVAGVLAILAWGLHVAPPGFLSWQGQLGLHYHLRVAGPELAGFGYSEKFVEPVVEQVSTLRAFLQREIADREPIFDFTNQPGLYHFLLDLTPASRYYHVSMAIRRRSQDQLIADLERTRPRLVVYQTEHGGLPEWDSVTNVVRHYDVSRYILDHYVPLTKVAGQTFYVARERPGSRLNPREAATEAAGQRCDWGFAPLHLETQGLEVGPEGRVVSTTSAVRLAASGWAALSAGAGPVKEIVAVSEGVVRARSAPVDYRADVARQQGAGAGTSGFRMFAEWRRAGRDEPQVTLLAVSETGEAGVLVARGGTGTEALALPAELGHVRLVPGATMGNVESLELSNETILQVEFPRDVQLSELAGLETDLRATRAGAIAISAVTAERVNQEQAAAQESRGVAARVPRSEGIRVRIPADNCPTWRASDGSTLFLRSDEGIDVRSVHALKRLE